MGAGLRRPGGRVQAAAGALGPGLGRKGAQAIKLSTALAIMARLRGGKAVNHRLSRGSLFALSMAALMTGAGALAGPVAAVSQVHFSPVELLQAADAIFGSQLVLSGVEAITGSRSRVSGGSDGR